MVHMDDVTVNDHKNAGWQPALRRAPRLCGVAMIRGLRESLAVIREAGGEGFGNA